MINEIKLIIQLFYLFRNMYLSEKKKNVFNVQIEMVLKKKTNKSAETSRSVRM